MNKSGPKQRVLDPVLLAGFEANPGVSDAELVRLMGWPITQTTVRFHRVRLGVATGRRRAEWSHGLSVDPDFWPHTHRRGETADRMLVNL